MHIATRDESTMVYRAADVLEHSHSGTCHIETSTIRDCTTALFQVTIQAVSTESRYKRQFGSNLLLFTPFKTVDSSTRDC